MKKELKYFAIGAIAALIATGSIAYARTGSELIEAEYNNIKIYVDGMLINPKDSNGNTVEPFIYNGTTYLPVRAVGETIGKQVSWDGATSSVYLGEVPGQATYLTDVMDAYESNECTKYSTLLGNNFNMGGKTYTNGFVLGRGYDTIYMSYAFFNLDGKYSSMQLDLGHVDGSGVQGRNIQFYVDGALMKEITVGESDLPQRVTIPLNYGLQLEISTKENGTKVMTAGQFGLGNIILE